MFDMTAGTATATAAGAPLHRIVRVRDVARAGWLARRLL